MKRIIIFYLLLLPFCLSAQLFENFDGPELTSSYQWIQDSDGFYLEDGQLLFNISGRSKGTSYIRVYTPFSEDMEWECDCSLTFNPTNSNHARMYVYATAAPSDLCFFVKIGSSLDNVSLYVQKGNSSPQLCIRGTEGLLDNHFPSVRVRLTMEGHRKWTLYTSVDGGITYRKEGEYECALTDLREGGYFNLGACYSARSYKEAYIAFDNLVVNNRITPIEEGGENPEEETEIPELTYIQPLSTHTLEIGFDLPVDIQEAVFSLSGVGKAYSQQYVDAATRTAILALFEGDMTINGEYTLSIDGLKSLSGKAIPRKDFIFQLTTEEGSGEEEEEEQREEVASGTILFNEIMANPKGLSQLPETEYIEFYNASATSHSLAGWTFIYGTTEVVLPDVELPSHAYAVLYREGRTIDTGEGLSIGLPRFPSALANTGKALQLLDATGHVVDAYTYPAAQAAKSWERDDKDWHLCTDPKGGTPGKVNSLREEETESPDNPDTPDEPEEPDQPDEPDEPDEPDLPEEETESIAAGEIIFNELLPNPYSGGSEYFELFNRSERTLHLKSLAVSTRKNTGDLSTLYPLPDITIEPEDYVVLTKDRTGVLPFYTIRNEAAIYEADRLPILANTSSTLVLYRKEDRLVIDEIRYSSEWHADAIKNEKGIALERISPDLPTQDADNWTSATSMAGYGTPGYENSQFNRKKEEESTGISTPVWSGGDEYTIRYQLDKSGYNCRMLIYNTSGQRIAEIANNELLGTNGTIDWDGTDTNGKRLSPGVYIFLVELYHPTDGHRKQYKNVFLIH